MLAGAFSGKISFHSVTAVMLLKNQKRGIMDHYFKGEKPSDVLWEKFGIPPTESGQMFKKFGCKAVLKRAHHLISGFHKPPFEERAGLLREKLGQSREISIPSEKSDREPFTAFLSSERYLKYERLHRREIANRLEEAAKATSIYFRTGYERDARIAQRELKKVGVAFNFQEVCNLGGIEEIKDYFLVRLEKRWAGKYSHISADVDCVLLPGVTPAILPSTGGALAALVDKGILSAASRLNKEQERVSAFKPIKETQGAAHIGSAFQDVDDSELTVR